MAHHKRGRARNRRAGCKMCKRHKVNGVNKEGPEGECHSDHVRRRAANEEVRQALREVDHVS